MFMQKGRSCPRVRPTEKQYYLISAKFAEVANHLSLRYIAEAEADRVLRYATIALGGPIRSRLEMAASLAHNWPA
jgi:hypothetical protein